MMLRAFLAAAGLSAAALTAAPAAALPLSGAAIEVPASAETVQWYDDDGPRWHRRGPPPWAPAWGYRRNRERYVYRDYDRPRYRAWRYYDERPYRRRPGVTLRFGY